MYKSQEREAWEQSPLYAMLKRRNVSQEEEDAIDGFIDWLEDEMLNEVYAKATSTEQEKALETAVNAQIKQIKALVDAYLWRNNPKVNQAEQELLERMKA